MAIVHDMPERSAVEGGAVTQRILELQADNLAFSTEIRSLQKRLVEVRARRQPTPPRAGSTSSSPRPGPETSSKRQTASEAAVSRSQRIDEMLNLAKEAVSSTARVQETPMSSQGAQMTAGFSARSDSANLQGMSQSSVSPAVIAPCVSAARTAVYLAQLPSVPPLPEGGATASSERLPAPVETSLPSQGEKCIDELKNENNRLTEQLVEASLESAQNFETFSNDRNALWNFTQELRTRVQNEQSERQRCAALLESTQDALERLAVENLQMAEDLMRARSGERSTTTSAAPAASGPFPDKTIDALWTVHRRETGRLRQEVQERLQECEQMRRFVSQQASQANATILEMARRNLELEDKLREACRFIEDHGLSIPSAVSSALSNASRSPLPVETTTSRETLQTEKHELLQSKSNLTMNVNGEGNTGSRERRSSSVPPQFPARGQSAPSSSQVQTLPKRNHGAWNAAVDVENEGSGTRTLRTATLAATTATEAANTATRAANAAAAAAEAAAQSESFARAEWRARLLGSGLVDSSNVDSIGNLTVLPESSTSQLFPKVSAKGPETPPNAVVRQLSRTKIDSPSGRKAMRRSNDILEELRRSSDDVLSQGLTDSFSNPGKLAEAREARKRHVTTATRPLPAQSSWLPAVSSCQGEFTLSAPMASVDIPSELATSFELQTERRTGSPRSPFTGVDYRYTGRGVGPQHSGHRSGSSGAGSSSRRNDRLQRDLDTMSAEMRRVQQRALLAAQ